MKYINEFLENQKVYWAEQKDFWSYAKNQDFFGLKIKYAVWIIPIPFLMFGFFLVLLFLNWIGILY